jgi:aminoglycoside 2''-phosphotransferase
MIDDIRERIRRAAPGLPVDDLQALGHQGWGGDSDAYLVDERWIFRFPRTPAVARALAVECCLLPRLAPRLPLPIPDFRYLGRDTAGAPAFVGYPAIPGEPLRPAHLAALDVVQVARVAAQLGAFLGALHRFPVADAVACGLSLPAESPRALIAAQLERWRLRVFPALVVDERRWVEDRIGTFLAGPDRLAYHPALGHGDLSGDHLLYDPSRHTLTGVIDFGDVRIGDPAGDFAWRPDYGDAFFAEVVHHYSGPADPYLAERTAFRADLVPLIQIGYGRATGRPEDVAAGRGALRARMAAGGGSVGCEHHFGRLDHDGHG